MGSSCAMARLSSAVSWNGAGEANGPTAARCAGDACSSTVVAPVEAEGTRATLTGRLCGLVGVDRYSVTELGVMGSGDSRARDDTCALL